MKFGGVIKNIGDGEANLISSIFGVRGPDGEVVFSQHQAFDVGDPLPPGRLKGSLISGNCPSLPKTLGEGAYQAVWTVNGINSNIVHFQIRSSRDEPPIPPIYVEPVIREKPDLRDDRIIGCFRNDQTTVVDLEDLWDSSILYIDGAPYRRLWTKWGGFSSLPPGRS